MADPVYCRVLLDPVVLSVKCELTRQIPCYTSDLDLYN